MNILETIISKKQIEVAENKIKAPVNILEASAYFNITSKDFAGAITNPTKHGIIAEIKTKSPSKGIINGNADIAAIALGYQNAGASCLSVLTDTDFFGGSNRNLILAREATSLPIIRKDFIIDEYQIIEAKSIGADAILLIAANLEITKCKQLSQFAKSLGLQILLELHHESELHFINEYVNVVGVNNRNLKTFEVSLTIAENLVHKIPTQIVKVAESGIDSETAYKQLKNFGYQGFLMGEYFMKQPNPGVACLNFINNL